MIKNFGNIIRIYREEIELSQCEVAKRAEIPQEELERIELGGECSVELQSKLFFVCSKDFGKTIEGIYDYIRFQFPSHNTEEIIENVLGIDFNMMAEEELRHYSYNGAYCLDQIVVYYSHIDNVVGTLIQLSGLGCRQFEHIMEQQGRTWLDFFSDCLRNGGHPTRIDIALNDYQRLVEIPVLYEKINKKYYTSTFRKMSHTGGVDMMTGESEGLTLYIGSKKSDFYLCFYEKDYEQAQKLNVDPKFIAIKNRYEIRAKKEKAYNLLNEILKTGDIVKIASSIFKFNITFLNEDKTVYANWGKLVSEVEGLKLRTKPVEKLYEKSVIWYRDFCASTAKMIKIADIINKTTNYFDIISEAKLSTNQEKMIRAITTNSNDLITKKFKKIK